MKIYLLEDDEIKSYLNELPSLEESDNAFEKYKKKVKSAT